MKSFTFLHRIKNRIRLLNSSLKQNALRFYIGDLDKFYNSLKLEGVEYLILRWTDNFPKNKQEEELYKDDIDHLIADNEVDVILKLASENPGPVKCDFYSKSGRAGTTYQGFPYYPPILADELMSNRHYEKRGFYRPSKLHEFLAFSYHLCYHKGLLSGIESGFESCKPKPFPNKNYFKEFKKLGKQANINISDDLSLYKIHKLLKLHSWDMPLDLMTRWPDQHDFIKQLIKKEIEENKDTLRILDNYTIFVLRDDCDTIELEEIAISMIKDRFKIIDIIRLDYHQRKAFLTKTRGGNWFEKYNLGEVGPSVAIICKNSENQGPLPSSMSLEKIRKRYPHLANTDVLIKREIRKKLIEIHPNRSKIVAIHATDNSIDTMSCLRALLDPTIFEKLK